MEEAPYKKIKHLQEVNDALLEALRHCVSVLGVQVEGTARETEGGFFWDALDQARAAIKQAEDR
jgi:hypothetical protein